MYGFASVRQTGSYSDFQAAERATARSRLACNWQLLRSQLLSQWWRLTRDDLDAAGPDRTKIAALVQRKYGISALLVENYLSNLERTLPVA